MLRILIIVTVLFFTSVISGQEGEQEDVSVNSQMWLDFNGKYRLDDNRSVSGFIGYRSISPRIFDKFNGSTKV